MGVTGTDITLVLRETKGSKLTFSELDGNQMALKEAIEAHSHDEFSDKQDALVSGESIKTINGQSLLGEGNITITGTDGSGDMSTTVYDSNADGKVDAADTADSVPWSGITDKPITYPPDTHTHDYASSDHNHDGEYEPIGAAAAAVAALVDSAPSTLDTLNELAAALGDDPNFATTVTGSLAGKQVRHGFVSQPAIPSFSGNTLTLPGSTPYSVMIGGAGSAISSAKQLTIDNPVAGTMYFATMQSDLSLASSASPWDILNLTYIPVSTAYYNAPDDWIIGNEFHQADRNLLEHADEHQAHGTRYISGFTSLTIGTGVVNNSTNTFSLEGGTISDEGLRTVISNPQTSCRIAYRNGSNGNKLFFDPAGAAYAKLDGTVPRYDNNGTLTDIGNSKFGVFWVYATNHYGTSIVSIVGQAEYASVAAAQAAPRPALTGFSTAEWKLLYRVIVRNASGTVNWVQSDPLYQVSTGPAINASAPSTVTADNVTATPYGDLASTTVQGQLQELQDEKQAALISGTNIKTINGASILGGGNIVVEGGSGINWADPVAVTTTATLTIGKHHVCSGTTADYTVTLPAVSGNAGKLLSIEMSGALTKLVTVDGNGSETIDGATTRVMWARETAILLCDGTQWAKVGGKSVPMSCVISPQSINQLFNANTSTKILCNTFVGDSPLNALSVNNCIIIPRSSTYFISAAIRYNTTNSTVGLSYCRFGTESAATEASDCVYRAASTASTGLLTGKPKTLEQNTYVGLWGFFSGGSFTTSTIESAADDRTRLALQEIVKW